MVDCVQISLLPDLLPLASILLAFSVAYLRLEPFQVSLRIAKYAEDCLRKFDDTEIKPHFTDTTDYQILEFLANSAIHKYIPNEGKIYRVLFRSGWDRRIAGFSTVVALGVLILGSLHSICRPFLAQYFGENLIVWWWLALGILALMSISLILISERIASDTKKIVDEHVRNLSEIIKGLKARDVELKEAATRTMPPLKFL